MSQPPPMPVIELSSVSKWYGDVIGVNQVSLAIGAGITGLLGPNGAGKSTLMKLITGQLKPGSGQVRVLGQTPWNNPQVFRRVGFCPDAESFYDEMTGLGFVTLMARMAGFSSREAERRARLQLERVSMAPYMRRRIRGYSKGMRQRVKLASALLHDPELIVLDEPLNGLDPMGRREMLSLFRALASEGKALLISSHILHEVEGLTRKIALIHRGRILAEGQIEEIRALIENQPLTLQISAPESRKIGQALADLDGVHSLTFAEQGVLIVRTSQPESVYESLQELVTTRGLAVRGLLALDDSLDAIFQYLVKE